MAGIDKTYAKNYQEYKEIIDYAKSAKFECPNGQVLHLINYCYEPNLTEKDFNEWQNELKESGYTSLEIPVMNTSYSIDYFLIKECPVKAIQDRMREVYSKEFVEEVLSGTSCFDKYERKPGTKVKWIIKPKYNKCKFGFDIWQVIHDDGYASFNEDTNTWVYGDELGYWTISSPMKRFKSIKALLRACRKWKLSIGSIVKITDGENYYELKIIK